MGMMEMQRHREDRRDRFQFTINAIEIVAVSVLAVMAMRTQYATTQMQIEATVKAAVQSHHEEKQKKSDATK